MTPTGTDLARRLACCHGYVVAGREGLVGVVETPVFAGEALAPEALLVRTVGASRGGSRLVASELVADLDEAARIITLRDEAEAG